MSVKLKVFTVKQNGMTDENFEDKLKTFTDNCER
jgi:hypothetical protein